jgi:glycosyltransferase involved in cell wall biosynthesis
MKYPNTGLYHYCLQLGKALQRNLDAEQETLKLYVRKEAVPAFGDHYSCIPQHSLHKFFMPLKKEYAVWHSTFQGTNYFPFRKKLKVVLTIHDLNFLYENKTPEKEQKYMKSLAKKIKHADHLVCISDFVLNDVKKHFDLTLKPCSVIYNGCNVPPAIIEELPATTRPKAPFLFSIGTVTDKKNFHVLPPLLEDNNLLLIIAGEIQNENYKQKILLEAKKYGVEDRVIFTGPVTENEKYWYMKNCEAFLFPSVAEGFGLPVIEAMYFGKPVILSTHTSLPEIGGDEAYYFPDFDPGHMRQALQQSLEHYATNQPAEKIRQRAAQFNWDKAAREYLQTYRTLY